MSLVVMWEHRVIRKWKLLYWSSLGGGVIFREDSFMWEILIEHTHTHIHTHTHTHTHTQKHVNRHTHWLTFRQNINRFLSNLVGWQAPLNSRDVWNQFHWSWSNFKVTGIQEHQSFWADPLIKFSCDTDESIMKLCMLLRQVDLNFDESACCLLFHSYFYLTLVSAWKRTEILACVWMFMNWFLSGLVERYWWLNSAFVNSSFSDLVYLWQESPISCNI